MGGIFLIIMMVIVRLKEDMMEFSQYKITEIMCLCEHCPSNDRISIFRLMPISNRFHYAPGQFALFKIDNITRAYSIASSPDMPYLEFVIHLIGGKLTSRLATLSKGDVIDISGPYGNPIEQTNRIGFICAGVGIAPVISFIRYYIKRLNNVDIVLFYSARSIEYMPYLDELKGIKQINVIPTLTRQHVEHWDGEYGRINRNMLLKHCPNPKERHWFICGSKGFAEAMSNILKHTGVPDNAIVSEGWG